MKKIAVLGSGSWGTALAVHFGRLGYKVRLWGRDQILVSRMINEHINPTYLSDTLLPELVSPTASLDVAVKDTDYILVAVPSHGMRNVIRELKPFLSERSTIVSTAKGLEVGTLSRMSEIIQQEISELQPMAVLSGPSFAVEVARQQPTAVVVAGRNRDVVEAVQRDFRADYLRLYGSEDVIGVEIGGALKNVIAIAAGVVEALDLGNNALAAVITRGLAEISRLTWAVGGRRETLSGLSGLGDLILTCTGRLSRNRHIGIELGRGRSLKDILMGMKMVAEGIKTTGAALKLADKHGIELPIAEQMAEVFDGRKDVRSVAETLMVRRQRAEVDKD